MLGLAYLVYKFFDKKSASGSGVTTLAYKSVIKNQNTQNWQWTEELHKPVYSTFRDYLGLLI